MLSLPILPMLAFGFLATILLTPLTRALAFRFGVVQAPGRERDLHTRTMPLLGGLAIFSAFTLSLLLFSPQQWQTELLAILLGTTLVGTVGFLDDRYSLPWGWRLGAMALAALLIISSHIQIRLTHYAWLDIPLTIFWVLTLVNALNFMDNMDGLSTGTAAICAGVITIIALSQGQFLVGALAASLTGSALGFLVFNFYPSSSFMGDLGAYVLGFILAVCSIKLTFNNQPLSVSWMVPIFALALPLFDISLVVFTRLVERRAPWLGGRDHSSHRLMDYGFGQRRTLLVLYAISLLFGIIAYLISAWAPEPALNLGVLAFVALGLLFLWMVWLRTRFGKRVA